MFIKKKDWIELIKKIEFLETSRESLKQDCSALRERLNRMIIADATREIDPVLAKLATDWATPEIHSTLKSDMIILQNRVAVAQNQYPNIDFPQLLYEIISAGVPFAGAIKFMKHFVPEGI